MRMALRNRRPLTTLIVVFLFVIGAYGVCEVYRHRDCRSDFVGRKGQLTSVKEVLVEDRSTDSLIHVQLEDETGIEVQGYLSIPSSTAGPYPALVIIGGVRTGKRTLDYIENTYDLALLALDYPYQGKDGKLGWWEFLKKVPDMRRAIMNTVPAVMLSVDYLEGRRDIDRDRIVLIGGSVGALVAPAIAASDPRISAVALLFGAGDLRSLLRANTSMPEPIASIVSWTGAILVSPVEPLKYIDRISPRPLFMLNGTNDARMPPRCSRLLHEKAKPPKTVKWIPTEHVHVSSKEFRDKVRLELEAWLVQNNILSGDFRSEEDLSR
ncbi:MAG: hypothetical protein AMJ46_01890 [Latescibacteria bacterium DG_63]|nr:MAG: hypothetical protein AMJ46_01890 [Latescibacteria bacterium DG_63]